MGYVQSHCVWYDAFGMREVVWLSVYVLKIVYFRSFSQLLYATFDSPTYFENFLSLFDIGTWWWFEHQQTQVWIALKRKADARLHFLCGSRALFTRPASIFFSKNNFKTGSYDTIHKFKNYFVTVFSVFSFQ